MEQENNLYVGQDTANLIDSMFARYSNGKGIKLNPVKQQPAVLPVLNATEALSEDQQKAVRAKYQELQKKFPHIKPKRLVRKVAEFFKVKLA